ncbi:MAG: DUF4859 domain-containing protein [Candidatus Cryptobacteroides sp.]
MKRTFRFMLAAAAAAFMVGCSKDTPAPTPTPKPGDDDDDPKEEELYADYVIRVDIKDYYYGLGYSGVAIDFSQYKTDDGQTIMEVFGYSSVADFCQNLCDAADGDKDVKFVLFDGDTKFIDESGSNTNGIGHWFTKQGQKVNWGTDSAFYTEGYYTESEEGYSLAGVLGSKPDVVTAEDDGMEYVIIEGFSSSEYDVAVEFHIFVTAEAPTVDVSKKGEMTIEMNFPYNGNYGAVELFTAEQIAEIEGVLGVSVDQAVTYPVNADGTLVGLASSDMWFTVEGNSSDWGAGCGIDVYYDGDEEAWVVCNYPDETLVGQTAKAQVMFTNSKNEGYLVNVVATLTDEIAWNSLTVDGLVADLKILPGYGYAGIQIVFDNDALAKELGLADAAALAAGITAEEPTVVVWGLNADGNKAVAEDGSRLNTGEAPYGHWFDGTGNVCGWGDTAAMCFNVKVSEEGLVYVNACEMPSTVVVAGLNQAYKQVFVAGEKEVVVTYNVSIVEAL